MAVKIYAYALQDLDGLLKTLEPTLPHGLSLYRRLQLSKERQEAMAFATFPPNPKPSNLSSLFTVGLLDYTSPGIQAFIFSSLEILEPTGDILSPTSAQQTDKSHELAFNQLIAILDGFRSRSKRLNSKNSHEEDIIFVGTVHSKTAALLRTYGNKLNPGLVRDDIWGPGGPYAKYIWRVPKFSDAGEESLPDGLYYDSIGAPDHNLIIENNDLVKNSQSLRYVPYGIGIRSAKTGVLAAWAFLGVEGGVRTLHVMPEHRRLGLGRKVAMKAAQEGLTAFDITEGEESVAWGAADIAASNVQSIGLFRSLGARWVQDSFWMRVDLAKVPQEQDF